MIWIPTSITLLILYFIFFKAPYDSRLANTIQGTMVAFVLILIDIVAWVIYLGYN